MNKIILTLTTAMALMFPATALADGNKLLKDCLVMERYLDTGKGDRYDFETGMAMGSCLGIVQGVKNAVMIMEDPVIKVCFPRKGINNGQAIRIVVSYLKQNPAELHERETYLIMLAFQTTYPCK